MVNMHSIAASSLAILKKDGNSNILRYSSRMRNGVTINNPNTNNNVDATEEQ